MQYVVCRVSNSQFSCATVAWFCTKWLFLHEIPHHFRINTKPVLHEIAHSFEINHVFCTKFKSDFFHDIAHEYRVIFAWIFFNSLRNRKLYIKSEDNACNKSCINSLKVSLPYNNLNPKCIDMIQFKNAPPHSKDMITITGVENTTTRISDTNEPAKCWFCVTFITVFTTVK